MKNALQPHMQSAHSGNNRLRDHITNSHLKLRNSTQFIDANGLHTLNDGEADEDVITEVTQPSHGKDTEVLTELASVCAQSSKVHSTLLSVECAEEIRNGLRRRNVKDQGGKRPLRSATSRLVIASEVSARFDLDEVNSAQTCGSEGGVANFFPRSSAASSFPEEKERRGEPRDGWLIFDVRCSSTRFDTV